MSTDLHTQLIDLSAKWLAVKHAVVITDMSHGLVSNEARCSNHECQLRHRCRRWLSREDPWRFERPSWRHGGETCDWKLLLPEDAPPTV